MSKKIQNRSTVVLSLMCLTSLSITSSANAQIVFAPTGGTGSPLCNWPVPPTRYMSVAAGTIAITGVESVALGIEFDDSNTLIATSPLYVMVVGQSSLQDAPPGLPPYLGNRADEGACGGCWDCGPEGVGWYSEDTDLSAELEAGDPTPGGRWAGFRIPLDPNSLPDTQIGVQVWFMFEVNGNPTAHDVFEANIGFASGVIPVGGGSANFSYTEPAFGPPGPAIPAVSEWGLVVMTLLVFTTGTLVYARRRPIHA